MSAFRQSRVIQLIIRLAPLALAIGVAACAKGGSGGY
jgi:hypothetical protein